MNGRETNDETRGSSRAWLLPLIAAIAAVAYGFGLDFGSKAFSIALKMTPALAMALEVYRQRRLAAWPMVAALTLHALGDGLLNLGSRFFLAGMAAFFVGHFGYIAAFLPYRYQCRQLPVQRGAIIVVLGISMAVLTLYIWPMLPGILAVASPLYSLALTAMAVTALLGRWRGPWVPIGAMLFVLSDILLGLKMFAQHGSFAFVIWPAYAAAQILMPLGYLQTPALSPRPHADLSEK